MFKKWLLALCMGAMALNACAAPDNTPAATDAAVRKAVLSLVPEAQFESLKPAPIAGFTQVMASGHLVYVSNDGKYMIDGDVVDLGKKVNLSAAARADYRKAELAKVPASDRIVFSPPNPRYRISVFTDVNCAYCRALHEHIKDYNKAGIAVEYLAWPREGVLNDAGHTTATYNEMVSVWCAADRKAAFTAAKQGHMPKATNCPNPVKDEFELGVKLGVTGTPAIVIEDGTLINGFMPPDELLQHLQTGT